MAVVELHDKDEIAALLRRNARAHVYEIGDLDDFDWPFTRWFGWERGGALEELVLLYTSRRCPSCSRSPRSRTGRCRISCRRFATRSRPPSTCM